jgi:cysteine desulfurase/selenocysteine lyase
MKALSPVRFEQLQRIPGLPVIGTAKEKGGVLSFVLDEYRTEYVGAALNRQGIAMRPGHHCAQPILRRFEWKARCGPRWLFIIPAEKSMRWRHVGI